MSIYSLSRAARDGRVGGWELGGSYRLDVAVDAGQVVRRLVDPALCPGRRVQHDAPQERAYEGGSKVVAGGLVIW